MKKQALISLFIIFSLIPMQGQVWKKIGNFSDNSLRAIHFPTKNTGYIVGYNGVVLKTTDGGEHWTILSVKDAPGLNSVYFTSENTGFTVGTYYIYKTTDGGKNWKKTEPKNSANLECLFFQNESTGFAGGWLISSPVIYKTTDAGNTWTGYPVQMDEDYDTPVINAIAFTDTQTGYAVGKYSSGSLYRGLLLKTTDGGKTWKEENLGIIASFTAITFVNSKTGFIIGDWYRSEASEVGIRIVVLKTTDGGKTWNEQVFPSITTGTMHFPDEQTGYFTSSSSEIYKTVDGGETWEPQKIDGLRSAICLYFIDKETGFVGGQYGEVFKATPILSGIEDATADVLPAAFPNPTRETVTLPYSLTNGNEGYLRVFNAGGVLIEQVKVTKDENKITVNVNGYVPGAYFYSCDGKSGKFSVE